jgi:methyltransferase (TIGR00027 family)
MSIATATFGIQKISDTALWAAAFRACESDREDALFRDPFAGMLAGKRGFEIASFLSTEANRASWVTRTYLFDEFLMREIAKGVDLVLNLGAGLDARPYRMALPASLQWVEVDDLELVEYKKEVLDDEKPNCSLERIGLDLRDLGSTRTLLKKLDGNARKILVLTEGVLIYLAADEVAALARELASHANIRTWICEIVSPDVLQNMRDTLGQTMKAGDARFQFSPVEGPEFFKAHGWKLRDVRGVLRTAVQLGRTPIDPKLLHLVPDMPSSGLPWVGVCLFEPNLSGTRP